MELVKTWEYQIEEIKLNTPNLQSQDRTTSAAVAESPQREHTYVDLPGLRNDTKDVLQQLQANINHLEDMGGRLGFALNEVRSLIRR